MHSLLRRSRFDRPQMTNGGSGRESLSAGDDRVYVYTVMPVEIRDGAGLAKVLDAERTQTMAFDRTEPGQRRWMSVKYGNNPAMRRQIREQAFDVRARIDEVRVRGHALPLSSRRSDGRLR